MSPANNLFYGLQVKLTLISEDSDLIDMARRDVSKLKSELDYGEDCVATLDVHENSISGAAAVKILADMGFQPHALGLDADGKPLQLEFEF